MGLLTSQKISDYYNKYKNIEVTYNKEIIQVTGLLTQQVHIKCGNDFWPCIVYSSSLEKAKIVANVKTGLVTKLQAANNFANLRFSFMPQGETNAVTFFVASRVLAMTPYGNSGDVNMFTLQFTNRPPDDFIVIMGRILDATFNSTKRQSIKVPLNADNMRRLGIQSAETAVFIEKVPRRCIIRDLSFSGSKIVMMGIAKFLINKEAALRIDFNDPREVYTVKGKFVRVDNVEGKKEMVAIALDFDQASIPMGFKIRLNDFLSSKSADMRGAMDDEVETEASRVTASASSIASAGAAAIAGTAAPAVPKKEPPPEATKKAVPEAAPKTEVPKEEAAAEAVIEKPQAAVEEKAK